MNKIPFSLLILVMAIGCSLQPAFVPRDFSKVIVEEVYDSTFSENIRAIEVFEDDHLAYATASGKVLKLDDEQKTTSLYSPNTIENDSTTTNFRSLAVLTDGTVFAMTIASPAKLYKITIGSGGQPITKIVYQEAHEKVFYDSMAFWNDEEGIVMGDPTANCLSVIITRNGGESWSKLPCNQLPLAAEGEAAFAASDTNIAIVDDHTWLFSGGKRSRVFYSPDKGKTWVVFKTPIIQGKGTQGIYSGDFYDAQHGIVIGGDYTQSEGNVANKAITADGGKTWNLVSDGEGPGYKSCVQYVPNRKAKEIVAVGFTGISYSKDGGQHWKELSKEGFYTIRFLNDSVAYAAGKNRVAKLTFR